MDGGEDEMAGQGGFDGRIDGLAVAHLADEHDVGVLAEEGAQGGGEGEVDLVADVDLVDPRDIELHGVLGGHDVLLHGVQRGDGRIEGVRLAASGRAGDQQDAPRPVDGFPEGLQRFGLQPELGHVDLEVFPVQDTGDDLLTEDARKGRDAHVHVLFLAAIELDPHLDAAVLGQAFLGDIHIGDDLDPRQDGVLELHGQVHRLEEEAVDAVAHAEGFFVGFEVDVAGALFDGFDEDGINQGDDRRFVGVLFVLLDVELLLGFLDDADLAVVGQLDVLDRLFGLDGMRGAVVFVDGVRDARFRGDHGLDAQARAEPDVLDHLHVGRIDHGQGQEGADAVDGHDHVFFGRIHGHQADDVGIDFELIQIDVRVTELAAQALGHFLGRNGALGDDGAGQGYVVLALKFLGRQQLIGGENFLTQENFAEA